MTGRAGVIAVAVLGCAVIGIGVAAKRCSGESAPVLSEMPEVSRAGSSTRRGHTTAVEQPTRALAGTVYLDGKPVIADVFLVDDFGVASRARSDAHGRFKVAGVRAAPYRLLASAPNAVPRAIAVDLGIDGRDVEIFLVGCAVTLDGEVRDASGGGIAGASILIGGLPISTTDAEGHYQLCFALSDSAIELTARADGYGDAQRKYIAGLSALDFDLVPEAIVAGRVETTTGQPVPDAIVELRPWEDGAQQEMSEMVMSKGGVLVAPKLPQVPITARTRSDADGRFEMRRLPSRAYRVLARTSELATNESRRIVAAAGRTDDLLIVVEGAATIRGVLLDSKTEQPRGGVPLFWVVGGIDQARTASAADGTFELLGLPPGPGRLGTVAPSYLDDDLVSAKVGDGPHRIHVTISTKISGHVSRDGHPVGGATVSVGLAETRSRADGAYELFVVSLGKTSVTAYDGVAFGTIEVTGIEGKDVEHADVVLDKSASIGGLLVDQSGAPIAGANVEVEYGDDAGQSLTRKDGRFTITMLSGGGPYAVKVLYEGARLEPLAGTAWSAIAVADGNTHVDNARLQAKLTRRTLGGRVVDMQGKAVSDALVTMLPGERTTHSAADGTFSVATAYAGPFTVEAKSAGLRQGRTRDVMPGKPVEIVMVDPGRIDIRCASKMRGVRLVLGRNTLAGACDTVVGPIVPGRYVVVGETGDVPVKLEPGETAIAKLAPLPFGTVEVIVPGAPVGATCGAPTEDGYMEMTDVANGTATIRAWLGERRIDCFGERSRGSTWVTVSAQPAKVTVALKPLD